MNQEKLNYFKTRLLAERQRLLDMVEGFERAGIHENMNDTAGELSAYDNHPADYGSQLAARQTDYGLLELTTNQLSSVSHALERVEQGGYGQCEACNKTIDINRLEALPYATLCVQCKGESENRESSNEINQNLSFGRSFKDGEDYTGFDGEDAWQAVARYGTSNSPQDIINAVDYDDTYLDADELIGAVTEVETIADKSRKYRPDQRIE